MSTSSPALPAVDHSASTHGTPYHRMEYVALTDPTGSARRRARWWRPPAELAGAIVLWGVFVLVLFAVAEICGVPTLTDDLDDFTKPVDLALNLALIGALVPAAVLAARWIGRPRGSIHSVERRFRWGLAMRAARVLLPAYLIGFALLWLLDPPSDAHLPHLDTRLVVLIAITVLLVPLQCAGEEYLFRGVPQRLLGTWLRSPAWGILLPVPLFVLGHGYDLRGQISVGVFAVCAGLIVWKTGGLEVAIVLHAVNNLPLFLLIPFAPSLATAEDSSTPALLVDLVMTIAATAWVFRWTSRSRGLRWWQPVVSDYSVTTR